MPFFKVAKLRAAATSPVSLDVSLDVAFPAIVNLLLTVSTALLALLMPLVAR
jgi:hypothetical protein